MRTSLGISAGSEVVCSATVATAPNGAQHFDYRVVTADTAHSDLGDLVASSIELMTTQIPRETVHPVGAHPISRNGAHGDPEPSPPGEIAVAYRDREQAQIIRSAIGRQRHNVKLIPESTAALAFLRHTGLLDRYETVAIIDLGATGATVTVADHADDTVLRSERTGVVSGNAMDELILQHLLDCHLARRGTRPNRGMLLNRSRAAKEHLSIAPAVTIDHVAGQPLKLTRVDFDELVADLLRELAVFARGVFARAPKFPEAVAVLGGGANTPAVLDSLEKQLDVPVFTVPEPESAIAKGAALVADTTTPATFQVINSLGADAPVGTFTKLAGTLAGAIVVVGLIVGYGIKEMIPEPQGTNYSPTTTGATVPVNPSAPTTPPLTPTTAGQTRGTVKNTVPSTAPSTGPSAAPSGSQTTATTVQQPPLRPDPDLPQIPFPADLPRILGPLLGTPLPTTTESNTGGSTTTGTTAPSTTAPSTTNRANTGSGGGGTTTLVRPTD
ncbi:Hsp70 family protein [Nocardia yamanashiensis]|uniref:Hsp70 family protein n=1 Tax=Nocardia yamanashiensis TaxID=209247 RepID=UPI001E3FBA5E|nr:Hsp70 family protein [Nocardia yamanashiensis]UGT39589.1 Hsp70 family protein [Nocardia yamanashiensis]